MSREPVVWANALAGIVAAAVSVGLLSTGQAAQVNNVVTALVGAAAFLIPLIGGLWARSRVTPVRGPSVVAPERRSEY